MVLKKSDFKWDFKRNSFSEIDARKILTNNKEDILEIKPIKDGVYLANTSSGGYAVKSSAALSRNFGFHNLEGVSRYLELSREMINEGFYPMDARFEINDINEGFGYGIICTVPQLNCYYECQVLGRNKEYYEDIFERKRKDLIQFLESKKLKLSKDINLLHNWGYNSSDVFYNDLHVVSELELDTTLKLSQIHKFI